MRRICSAGMSPQRSAVATAATRPQATSDPDHSKSNAPIETPPGSTNRPTTCRQPDRDQQAGERTAAREQERLGEKEPQQAEPAHAESHPDRGLPPPVLVPRQHQPGQIRAPHEEHQTDHGDEQADEAFRLRPGPERQGRRHGRHERHRFRLLGRGARGGEHGERRFGTGGAHSRSQLSGDGDPELGREPQAVDRDDGIGKVVRRRQDQGRRAEWQEEVGRASQIQAAKTPWAGRPPRSRRGRLPVRGRRARSGPRRAANARKRRSGPRPGPHRAGVPTSRSRGRGPAARPPRRRTAPSRSRRKPCGRRPAWSRAHHGLRFRPRPRTAPRMPLESARTPGTRTRGIRHPRSASAA